MNNKHAFSNNYGTIETGHPDGPPGTFLVIERTQRRRRRTISCRAIAICVSFTIFILLAIFSVPIVYFGSFIICSGILNPPFEGPRQWSDFRNTSFAVGFDLTAGYGTASVLFDNGTTVDVGRVDGTSEYNEVLARLSLTSSVHPTPPYYNCDHQSKDLSRQWRRYFNKRAGSPASSDVAALVGVLGKLKEETNNFLGSLGPLEMAFITVPSLPALYNEELLDAADHVNVQILTLPWYIHRSGDQAQWPVTEINAAFAGNGFGLDGTNPPNDAVQSDNLEDEKDSENTSTSGDVDSEMFSRPWSDNIFAVLFTDNALTAHVSPIASAYSYYAANGIANFSLGLSSAAFDPASYNYWVDIHSALRTALDSYLNRGHDLGRVYSYGENAHHEIFDRILKEVVLAAQTSNDPEQQPIFSGVDPVYAAARGAAKFAEFCKTIRRPGDCFPDLTPKQQGW